MTFQKLTSDEYEMIKKIERITLSDYELIGDFVPSESLMIIIEDLYVELEKEREKNADLRQDIKDNYRPISIAEQVGISDRDFV